jgi:hypothetical protein
MRGEKREKNIVIYSLSGDDDVAIKVPPIK